MEKASVIMPVYNGEAHLSEAVESILAQSFSDFTFIAVDDASSDNSLAILHSYRDKRLRIIKNAYHRGITYALNQGLAIAEGEVIFRMDADDISHPQRFQRQFQFMREHPHIFACGADTDLIDDAGNRIGYRDTKKGDQPIKIALFLGETSLPHPAVAIRASTVKQRALRYVERYPYAEDYEFWCRCSTFGTYENLPEPLLRYRHHSHSVSQAFKIQQRLSARQILTAHLRRLGLRPSPVELSCHMQFALGLGADAPLPEKAAFERWRHTLIQWNRRERQFAPDVFEPELEQRYSYALQLWR